MGTYHKKALAIVLGNNDLNWEKIGRDLAMKCPAEFCQLFEKKAPVRKHPLLDDVTYSEVEGHLRTGHTIQSIQLVRKVTGMSLASAKEVIDEIRYGAEHVKNLRSGKLNNMSEIEAAQYWNDLKKNSRFPSPW